MGDDSVSEGEGWIEASKWDGYYCRFHQIEGASRMSPDEEKTKQFEMGCIPHPIISRQTGEEGEYDFAVCRDGYPVLTDNEYVICKRREGIAKCINNEIAAREDTLANCSMNNLGHDDCIITNDSGEFIDEINQIRETCILVANDTDEAPVEVEYDEDGKPSNWKPCESASDVDCWGALYRPSNMIGNEVTFQMASDPVIKSKLQQLRDSGDMSMVPKRHNAFQYCVNGTIEKDSDMVNCRYWGSSEDILPENKCGVNQVDCVFTDDFNENVIRMPNTCFTVVKDNDLMQAYGILDPSYIQCGDESTQTNNAEENSGNAGILEEVTSNNIIDSILGLFKQ